MKLSARNVLRGTVTKVVKGAVNAEVEVQLNGGDTIVSVITVESLKSLGVKKGKEVWVVVKASSVMIGVEHGER
jgi:molybdopterin-binding protein